MSLTMNHHSGVIPLKNHLWNINVPLVSLGNKSNALGYTCAKQDDK
jgi:hypothetical protein